MKMPVILVHGFGEDRRVWDQQVKHLEKNYKLIVPDLPGSGNEKLADVSMESMANYLKNILDEQSISSCIMIGHSMGGYVTLAFAEKYPELLSGFGLFHSSAYADSEEKKETRKKAIEFIRKNGTREFLKTSVPNLIAKNTRNREELIRKLIDEYAYFEPDALIAYYEAMIARPNRTTVLKEFTKPILMVLGVYDTAVPYEQGKEQVKLLQNPVVHTLKNSAHMGMLEEPAESNAILADYINIVI
ncbi:MAG TPA: alpha/beta hydrolase [Chitinophagaceae bacterium]|nr:alpha/beta hydrolase [Chitinophagaceae bacterium]